jgi:Double zinc ribbon
VSTRTIETIVVAFFVVFWIASAFWTYKDARRRIDDRWLLGMATLLGIVPYLGPLVYMLFRPPEYLEDVRERNLEIKAMEDTLSKRGLICPVCHANVESTYLVCPVCTTKLRQACVNCRSPLEALWQVCPYCETPIEPAGPPTSTTWGVPDL